MFFPASGCERLERAHADGTERFSQIVRYLERLDAVEERPGSITLGRRDLGEPRRRHVSFFEETSDAHLVRARPSAPGPAWREEQRRALVVEGLVHAVDPAVAQRVRNGVLVGEAV